MKYGLFIAGLIAASTISTSHASNAEQVKSNFVISSYAKTKYPLVFAHGMGGWIRAGTDELGVDYWYQILPDLARNGANAWATRVSPFNSSEVRGEQLLQQVDEILAITGANKVNLLGHSHGGHSIAYVSNIAPAKVASATAISSPLKGSPVADLILSAQGTPLEQPLVSLINFGSQAIVWAQQQDPNSLPHDALAAGISLSQAGSKTFAQKYTLGMPESACGEGAAIDNGIYFYSFSGNSTLTNILDPDSVLAATGLLMQAPNDNDGLVSRCSAKYGKTIRDNYNWNHLDVINQFFALRSVFSPDPVDIYRQHANRLKLQGL
ncbi:MULTISPECIES: esterase/lipase family protein [Acinetobacter]|uniref:esterase/lipase family protein n=1 Tax=Acinetobacter TaxID=469 RepID=UPI000263E2F3|nr:MULTISPECIES: triacylglycerol lipase [Acinetobacter]EIM40458.1 acetyltransferase and hydrolase with the alpha/beta hydrolase fold protein [Acinetobacter sp. HA]MBB4834031.1 triacylglycerol lipase [Acinetobacter schindleri]RAZ05484.1 triacylglycerol lipase [Acinetobacter sp. SM1B]WBX38402.1 triacylglycerol lipase [Acinetobacter schindleri]